MFSSILHDLSVRWLIFHVLSLLCRNPNETPPSSIHISHLFKHNHVASPIEHATSKLIADNMMNENGKSHKQKRQMTSSASAAASSSSPSTSAMVVAASTSNRWRTKRNHDSYETDESNEEDNDEENEDADENGNGNGRRYEETHNHDRFEDTLNQHNPFWDTYDSVNQLYLEVGKHELRELTRRLKL